MIHLTHSGSRGDRPLCNCHRVSHQAMGDAFLAVIYASPRLLQSDELCLACRQVLDGWHDENVAADLHAPIEWLDVEEVPPSIPVLMG